MNDELFVDYINAYHSANDIDNSTPHDKRHCLEIEALIRSTDDGSLPLSPTAHSTSRFANRLEQLVASNNAVYIDVMTNDSGRLFMPSQAFVFVMEKALKARMEGGIEGVAPDFKYEIVIDEWSDRTTKIVMVAHVSKNNLKTVYFNAVNNED